MEVLQLLIFAVIGTWAVLVGHYIFGAVALIAFLWQLWSYWKRRQVQRQVLAKYGYTKSPVLEIRGLIYRLKYEQFAGVKRIVGERVEVLKKQEKWAVALELYEAFAPPNQTSALTKRTGVAGVLAEGLLKQMFEKQLANRIIIVEKTDGTVLVAWGIYIISDKRLQEFYELAKQRRVVIEDTERTAGTIF